MKKLLLISLFILWSCEDDKDTTPPELTILSPTLNSTVGEVVNVKVETSDKSGILKVDFFVDNKSTYTDTITPYEYVWNTTEVSDGVHTIKVQSYDTEENMSESEVNVTVDNLSKKPTKPILNKISYDFEMNVFKISWESNNDNDFESFVLYESESEDMAGKTEIYSVKNNSVLNYDVNRNQGLYRYYQLVVNDKWGLTNESDVQKGDSHNWFVRVFGGSDSDLGHSVQQTLDGGYIIVGSYINDVYVVKTNSRGQKEWEKTFGGSFNDVGQSVQQTIDGGYIIAGHSQSDANGYVRRDVSLIKINTQGQEEWSKKYGKGKYNFGQSVQQTTDGGFIIGGKTHVDGINNYDVYLIKTNSLLSL